MREFRTQLKEDSGQSVAGLSLAEIWSPDVTNHPIWMVWATTPGATRPVQAAAASGARFTYSGYGVEDVRWPRRDGPAMVSRTVSRGGTPDHVQTVAYFRTLCDQTLPDPSESDDTWFLVVPPSHLITADDGALGAAAARHFGITLRDEWAPLWTAYAALFVLYLSRRTRYPILPGPVSRALLLAAAVCYDSVGWTTMYGAPRRISRIRQHVDGLAELGYGDAMLFKADAATVRRICQVVPGLLSRRYGTASLTSPHPPPGFLDIDARDGRKLLEEVRTWLD